MEATDGRRALVHGDSRQRPGVPADGAGLPRVAARVPTAPPLAGLGTVVSLRQDSLDGSEGSGVRLASGGTRYLLRVRGDRLRDPARVQGDPGRGPGEHLRCRGHGLDGQPGRRAPRRLFAAVSAVQAPARATGLVRSTYRGVGVRRTGCYTQDRPRVGFPRPQCTRAAGAAPKLAAHAIRAGLVDEFQMIVCRVVGGGGKRFFPDGVRLEVELVEERRFRKGVVVLRYAVRGRSM